MESHKPPKRTGMLLLLLAVMISRPALGGNNCIYSADELRQRVRQFIHQRYAGQPGRIEIEWRATLTRWIPGKGIDSIAVHYPQTRLPAGNTMLQIQAYRAGRVVRRLSYPVRVRVFQKVAVCNISLRSKQPLSEGDVIWVEREITDFPGSPLVQAQPVSGFLIRRAMKKGSILKKNDLLPVPVVHRGETVTLVYDQRSVRIKLQARALQDGAPGDQIWFYFPESRKRFRGEVVGPDLATIIP